jgi:hypothetical protein
MSTEKKNEKWKTFFMEERKGNGVQSFSHPMGFLRAQPHFASRVKGRGFEHRGHREKKKRKSPYPLFSLRL